MTQQTNGMPELKYSEETFRALYETLKELCSILIVHCSMDYLDKHNLSLPLSKGEQVLAKAENKS